MLPEKRTLTFSRAFFLIVAVELYLQLAFRRTVLEDRVLLPFLNTTLIRPEQTCAAVGLAQYLASLTPAGHLSGMQLRAGAFSAQNTRGNLTDPVVLNLYGLFLSRLGVTLEDVEEAAVPD